MMMMMMIVKMMMKMKNNYSNNIPYSVFIHTYVHIYILLYFTIYICSYVFLGTHLAFSPFSFFPPSLYSIVLYERESMLLRYGLGWPGLQFGGAFDHTTANGSIANAGEYNQNGEERNSIW